MPTEDNIAAIITRYDIHMTKTNFSLLTLALLTSTSVMARVVEPSFTVESAIHTYKINADATYELTEEVITRINTQQTANDSPDCHCTLYSIMDASCYCSFGCDYLSHEVIVFL